MRRLFGRLAAAGLLFAVFAPGAGLALQAPAPAPQPPQAAAPTAPAPPPAALPVTLSQVLEKTQAHYQKATAWTAAFIQTTASAAAASMKTEAKGRLSYQKPRQMRWDYETPEQQTFIANGELAWLYVPGEHQISLFEGARFFSSPIARTFFDGVFDLKKNFDVALDTVLTTVATAVLKCVPKTEDPNVAILRLWVDLTTYRINIIETSDAQGNTNLVQLLDQRETKRLDAKLFDLAVPPGTLVVDAAGKQLTTAEIEALRGKLAGR